LATERKDRGYARKSLRERSRMELCPRRRVGRRALRGGEGTTWVNRGGGRSSSNCGKREADRRGRVGEGGDCPSRGEDVA